MRRLGHAIGVGFLFLAAAALVAQVLAIWAGGGWRSVSLLTIWNSLDRTGLGGFLGLIEDYLPVIVQGLVRGALALPACLTLAVPGALLILFCRPRQRGIGRF